MLQISKMTTPKIIYHPQYNIQFIGLEALHPFDSKKYGRVWKHLYTTFGQSLSTYHLKPTKTISQTELFMVHTANYLHRLTLSTYLAQALEVPLLRYLPAWLINWVILKAMQWATKGTILAMEAAFEHGLAINLSGGYHHAKPTEGEGFCLYADIAIAIAQARQQQLLAETETVLYIDLDAHQGNGVCHCFLDDNRVQIFDMYNGQIYPSYDEIAQARIDYNIPLPTGCQDAEYLGLLKSNLPNCLSSITQTQAIGLAIYTAGTDVYQNDRLGQLAVSQAGILERDLFVLNILRAQNIPTVMLLGGGYTSASYQLVANTVETILQG